MIMYVSHHSHMGSYTPRNAMSPYIPSKGYEHIHLGSEICFDARRYGG